MTDTLPRTGDVLPELSLPLLDGGSVRLPRDYQGQRLLVFMWASW